MNEAQAITGRWAERRAWFAEMSAYLKSLDPNHMIAPGAWGYRSSSERREWLADHAIPTIDYCDVHSYPRDDHDSFVDSPTALKEFIENRAAAAFSIKKPLVWEWKVTTALRRSNGTRRSLTAMRERAQPARCFGY
jgi:hypothetical protein